MLNLEGKPELNENRKIIPFDYKGIKVMSIGFLLNEDQPVIWRGPMVHSAIKQMAQDTDWGNLDILIVDMPPGTGDAQITVSQNLPLNGAIVISTPQSVALNDAKKAIGMFEKVDVKILGIVENMSYFILPDGSKEDIFGKDGAGKIKLRAAPKGTGIIAGGPMRAVFETLGVQDVVSKSIGSSSPYNMVRATFNGLQNIQSPRNIAARRGLKVSSIFGKNKIERKQENKKDG